MTTETATTTKRIDRASCSCCSGRAQPLDSVALGLYEKGATEQAAAMWREAHRVRYASEERAQPLDSVALGLYEKGATEHAAALWREAYRVRYSSCS